MLDLAEIPFFDDLPADSVRRLRARVQQREWPQGTVIVRVGEEGKYFQAIASGVVRVLPNPDGDSNWRGVMLGPGQVFGEMSLFSGLPVSATLVAARDTVTWAIDGATFLTLLESDPILHRRLTRLLIERLRNRTRNESRVPAVVLVVGSDDEPQVGRFMTQLMRGVQFYAPGSELLPPASEPHDHRLRIDAWRREAAGGQFLVVRASRQELSVLVSLLEASDLVLDLLTHDSPQEILDRPPSVGLAYLSRVWLRLQPPRSPGLWSFHVPEREIEQAGAETRGWKRSHYPMLDHLARHVTFKEVGVAMSSGAARGFAHLGVLEVLEELNFPLDYLCGTSMGGITALTVARSASVASAAALMEHYLGSNRKIMDVLGLPRSALFNGRKIARAAEGTFGDCTFADLSRPTAVVAADLAAGERAVLDRGPVAPAVLATSAIPGFFPPVLLQSKVLVDGVVVSRVPVDLLSRRRCGLKIAVNVLPSARQIAEDDVSQLQQLWERMNATLGLKRVMSVSWELLSSWGSSLEAMRADLIITPETPVNSSFDFDRYRELVASGRHAVEERRDAMQDTLRTMLEG